MVTWSLLPLLLSVANAAEVTSIPPFLRGDVDFQYTFDYTLGDLTEQGEPVASRSIESHEIVYGVAFGAAPGLAVFLEAPQNAATRVSFASANEMIFDPSLEQGTMLATDPIDPAALPEVTGNGMEGIWFGLRGTPFSQAFKSRGNRATWLVEGGLQTKDETSFWNAANGARGGGPGGAGQRVRTSFSTTFGPSNPYMDFTYTRHAPYEVDLYDSAGNALAQGVTLDPANEVKVRLGTELVAHDNPAAHSRFAIDLRLAFAYRSWQTIQSGVMLPSILSKSAALPVTESEYNTYAGGLGFYYQAFEYMQFNLRGDATYITPHRIEHPYPILTGLNTVDIAANFGIKVMVR